MDVYGRGMGVWSWIRRGLVWELKPELKVGDLRWKVEVLMKSLVLDLGLSGLKDGLGCGYILKLRLKLGVKD
jgi:hypothetical protein